MATGASTAEAAVLLVDARHGILTQTRRHSFIVSLLGIRHVAVAVNKMDLLDFDRDRFEAIRESYMEFARDLGFDDIACIPVSALKGDNVLDASTRTPWYDGPTLLGWLESVPVDTRARELPFRMPVCSGSTGRTWGSGAFRALLPRVPLGRGTRWLRPDRDTRRR